MDKPWLLEWSHGRAAIHPGAGAIGRTDFLLQDGRWANPFHEAPWIARNEPVDPPGLAFLRGEWPCLPFGRPYLPADGLPEAWALAAATPLQEADGLPTPDDRLLHGFGANAAWSLVSHDETGLVIGLDYPQTSAIIRIERRIAPVPGKAALDVGVTISARRACMRPFGFHPNFALHGAAGSFRIEPGAYQFGRTHPSANGVTLAKPDARFDSLETVPLAAGGSDRFDRLPFIADREEILQLCGIDGHMRLVDARAAVAWTLSWDPALLPSCVLWMSNRGRHQAPWNGQNLCVGVEPAAAPFDLGSNAAAAANPISEEGVATAIRVEPGKPLTLAFRIAGEAL